ncbi:MAG: phosphoribosylanthranilate isomerase [Planctomycetota bacterium]
MSGPGRTRIKVCGVTSVRAAVAAAEAGADAVGLMFVPQSPRAVRPDVGFEIMSALPPMTMAIGVVRDLAFDEFVELEQACPCHHMQLHGSENEATVEQCGPDVIRAIKFNAEAIDADLQRWANAEGVGAILVDGSAGGEGTEFDWSALAAHVSEGCVYGKPLIVAGGLSPENVAEAVRTVRPYAVDVSSGVESSPGVKDDAKLRAFCDAVREADSSR